MAELAAAPQLETNTAQMNAALSGGESFLRPFSAAKLALRNLVSSPKEFFSDVMESTRLQAGIMAATASENISETISPLTEKVSRNRGKALGVFTGLGLLASGVAVSEAAAPTTPVTPPKKPKIHFMDISKSATTTALEKQYKKCRGPNMLVTESHPHHILSYVQKGGKKFINLHPKNNTPSCAEIVSTSDGKSVYIVDPKFVKGHNNIDRYPYGSPKSIHEVNFLAYKK